MVSHSRVVSSARLSEHEVVRAEDLSRRSRADTVHSAGLQVNKDSTEHIFPTGGLIVVKVESLEMEINVSVMGAGRFAPPILKVACRHCFRVRGAL